MSKLALYKKLILKKEYFLAHEALEEEWRKLKKTNNNLQYAYKGLINAAVSLELKKRNKSSYSKAWKNFEKYKNYYIINNEIFLTYIFVRKFKP